MKLECNYQFKHSVTLYTTLHSVFLLATVHCESRQLVRSTENPIYILIILSAHPLLHLTGRLLYRKIT